MLNGFAVPKARLSGMVDCKVIGYVYGIREIHINKRNLYSVAASKLHQVHNEVHQSLKQNSTEFFKTKIAIITISDFWSVASWALQHAKRGCWTKGSEGNYQTAVVHNFQTSSPINHDQT